MSRAIVKGLQGVTNLTKKLVGMKIVGGGVKTLKVLPSKTLSKFIKYSNLFVLYIIFFVLTLLHISSIGTPTVQNLYN